MGRRSTGTVRAAGNRIQVGYTSGRSREWFTVDLKPTKANLEAVKRNIHDYIQRHEGTQDTFSQVAQTYLDSATLEASTRKSYRDSLNIYYMPYLSDRDLLSLRFSELDDIDKDIQWPSAKTRRNALCALRGVFKYGYLLAQVPWRNSPAHQLQLGKPEKTEPDPYTRDERNQIIEEGGIFEALAFGTGARTGELIALSFEDVSDSVARIHRSRVRSIEKGTKTDKPRNVRLPDWLWDRLRNDPNRFKGGAILRNQYDRPYMRGNKLLTKHKALVESLGIRYRTPYAWRSTYASLALMDGASPEFVAQQLGHSVEVMRQHYGKWIEGEYDQVEVEKMKW